MENTIEPGSSVSHYRIISAIGAGGMGQVYKAQDTTLERTVALKVLPPELVRNDERVRRFMQEAKSASSLNHPNIVTIHEIGQFTSSSGIGGESPHPIHYIAMELIDGATLKRKIHDGVTDLRTLLGYLTQAAEGLAKAHAAGIIHRDLKPENMMVTRDGFTKVLDFGLAKLSVKKSASDGNTATEVREGTREGAILGTVGYMSPEQVRGEIVDHRSDIFSFGCILYEAATKRRPFEADSDIDVMHKIMHEKPAPVDEINPKAPAELRRLIRRCLSKDPERRYQSMKDLALELSDVVDEFDELSASTASRSSGSISQPLIVRSHRGVTALSLAAIVAVLIAAVIGLVSWRRNATEPKKLEVAYGSMKIEQLTTSNDVVRAAISPDGKYVALVTNDGRQFTLSVLQVATQATVQVVPPMPTPFTGVAFSPDSNYLLYNNYETVSGRGYASLYQVPSLGGTPRRLLFDVDTAVSFSPDGRQITFGRGHPDTGEYWLMIANADGTGARKLVSLPLVGQAMPPAWSPDGKTIVTSHTEFTGGLHDELLAFDVAAGARHTIGKHRWGGLSGGAWLPNGDALLLTASADLMARQQVWIQPYPDGDPVRVTNDLNQYTRVSATSDGKVLAVIRGERSDDLIALRPGAAGSPLVPHNAYEYETVSVARSGLIAVTLSHEKGLDVAVIAAGSNKPVLVTHDGKSAGPVVSADGTVIVYESIVGGGVPHLYVTDSDGSAVRQLTNGSGELAPSIAPDGHTVTFATLDRHLWRVNTSGGAPVRLADAVSDRFNAAPISPDGKKIAYLMWRQSAGPRADRRLVIADIESGKTTSELPFSIAQFRWSAAGDAILFVDRAGGVANIFSLSLSGGEPKVLTTFTEGDITSFDSTADGRLIIATSRQHNDVVMIRDFR